MLTGFPLSLALVVIQHWLDQFGAVIRRVRIVQLQNLQCRSKLYLAPAGGARPSSERRMRIVECWQVRVDI